MSGQPARVVDPAGGDDQTHGAAILSHGSGSAFRVGYAHSLRPLTVAPLRSDQDPIWPDLEPSVPDDSCGDDPCDTVRNPPSVPTGSWGRPLQPNRLLAAPSRAPTRSRPFTAAPPPPPPAVARATLPVRRRTHRVPRRWWREALAAVLLLAALAAIFHPRSTPVPSPAPPWLAAHSRRIGALVSDISHLQRSRSPEAVRRLRDDLAVSGEVPPPPPGSAQKAWNLALEQSKAAVRVLSESTVTPTDSARADDDLAAASDALAAVVEALSGPGSLRAG